MRELWGFKLLLRLFYFLVGYALKYFIDYPGTYVLSKPVIRETRYDILHYLAGRYETRTGWLRNNTPAIIMNGEGLWEHTFGSDVLIGLGLNLVTFFIGISCCWLISVIAIIESQKTITIDKYPILEYGSSLSSDLVYEKEGLDG